jgi:hypothetical protein
MLLAKTEIFNLFNIIFINVKIHEHSLQYCAFLVTHLLVFAMSTDMSFQYTDSKHFS